MKNDATDHDELRAQRTERFSDMLLRVTNDLAKTESLDEALETLVNLTTSTIGAERGTIFLNDKSTGELYSRVAQGNFRREIRILNTKGVAGWVFTNNEGVIIHDAYKDERFNKAVDVRTGFRTKSILCAPLRTISGEEIGVSQILNRVDGEFTEDDLELLLAMTEQAAVAIQGNIIVEQIEAARKQELEFLDVVSQVSSEFQKNPKKIFKNISKILEIISEFFVKMFQCQVFDQRTELFNAGVPPLGGLMEAIPLVQMLRCHPLVGPQPRHLLAPELL